MSLQKRRPFGSAAANYAVDKDARKGPPSVEPRKSKATAHLPKPKRNDSRDEKRKSKTPKTSNLSSVGGAYNFQTDFARQTKKPAQADQQIHRGAVEKPSRAKPDPSPIKRPDPTSKMFVKQSNPAAANVSAGLVLEAAATGKSKPSSKAAMKPTSAFASPTKRHVIRNSSAASTNGCLFKPNAPSSALLSRLSERDASSDMDVDSECSSPEKSSPLITSPHTKPDPEAVELLTGKMSPRAQKTTNLIYGAAATSKQKEVVPNERLKVEEVSEEVLARARIGPIENKDAIEAMLNSSNNKAVKLNGASQTEASGQSLVGSIIGGAYLQRCPSLDGSEVTMPSMLSCASNLVRGHQSIGVAAVFREHGSTSIPGSNVHLAPSNLSSTNFLRRPTAEESARLSMQIGAQLQSGYTYPSQIHLPAGWQVRISKSKGKPYYVHPDFGSTWYYPGLIAGSHIAVQNEVFADQSVDVSRFTSHASAFHRSFDASNTMQSAATTEVSKGGMQSSAGRESNEKSAADLASSAGKRSDDAVVQDKSANSQASSSNASQSKCLTQDSFVNSQVPEPSNDATNSIDSDVNATAELKQTVYTTCGEMEFETERDAFERTHANDECKVPVNEENDNIEFGTDRDNFDIDRIEDEDELSLGLTDNVEHASIDDNVSTVDAVKRDDANSLASDHVDVDSLLRQSERSPLATIREILRESSGKLSRQSSQVSLSSTSDHEDRLEIGSKQSKPESYPPDDSSHVSHEGSVHEKSINQEDDFDNNGFDLAANGFSDDEENSIGMRQAQSFDESEDDLDGTRFELGGGLSDDEGDLFGFGGDVKKESPGSDTIEASAKQPKKRRKKLPPVRRKTFPPGPLCSLQMLQMIEGGELDTPLWRMSKRKRSTWTSVKRARERRKDRRISA